ncbi:MAG: hypothetical protein EAZ58_05965 [Flavobacterium sp.]|nr:MAG: hypothetical protein EAZ58_05965 [Flavobacterium sp.]
MPDTTIRTNSDVVLIGAGIMSATLGLILKELQPDLQIEIFERLDAAALESTDAWNNAGTGHSAFCELNYTPEDQAGTISDKKAIAIAESYEVSKQFWAYLIQQNKITSPEEFISKVPHLSFVWGEKNVEFLKNRFELLQKSPLFKDMEYATDFEALKKWMPLVMNGREASEKVAATKMDIGTDVNFGELTKKMLHYQCSAGTPLFIRGNSTVLQPNDRAAHPFRIPKFKAKFQFRETNRRVCSYNGRFA